MNIIKNILHRISKVVDLELLNKIYEFDRWLKDVECKSENTILSYMYDIQLGLLFFLNILKVQSQYII